MICEELYFIAIVNNQTFKIGIMTLFILYQTDIWKSKASRVFFGVFDSRTKAVDCAKYQGLYTYATAVVIKEVTLNLCEENQ